MLPDLLAEQALLKIPEPGTMVSGFCARGIQIWVRLRNDIIGERGRKARALEMQRRRRAKHRRIDYYPNEAAGRIIDARAHTGNCVGEDYSSVINRIIEDWARFRRFLRRDAP
jgi:hypothetical protein